VSAAIFPFAFAGFVLLAATIEVVGLFFVAANLEQMSVLLWSAVLGGALGGLSDPADVAARVATAFTGDATTFLNWYVNQPTGPLRVVPAGEDDGHDQITHTRTHTRTHDATHLV
jgi:hypothetical protein